MELQLAFSTTPNIIIIIFITIFSLLSFKKLFTRSKAKNLPPGPWKLPIIGSLHHLATGSLRQYTLTKLSKQYGPLMHLKLGEISAVVVSSPQMAKLFLKTHEAAFEGRPSALAVDIFTYGKSDVAFSPCNSHWQLMRKICVHELLSNNRVESFRSIREDEVSDLITFVERSVGSPIDLSDQLYSLSCSITCKAVFGEKFVDKRALISLVNELTNCAFNVSDLFPSLSFLAIVGGLKSKLKKKHRKMDLMLDDIIDKRCEYNKMLRKRGEKGNHKQDLLDVLLKLQQENDPQLPIVNSDIKAVLFEMLAAGIETLATVIEWAMTEMVKNPRIMEKVQTKLRRNPYEIKNFEEKSETDYLKLVIKETLRLHPPAPLNPRECTESRDINGYTIPVKTSIILNIWAIGRDPEYWDDADKFIPERFEKNKYEYNGSNFEYIPFGVGRRICPGTSFAIATIEIVLAQLLYHFNWKVPNKMKPEELDMTAAPGVIGKRKTPLYLVADLNEATLRRKLDLLGNQ